MPADQAAIGLGPGLGHVIGGGDIEYGLEVMVDGQPVHDPVGMVGGAVGENDFPSRQPGKRPVES